MNLMGTRHYFAFFGLILVLSGSGCGRTKLRNYQLSIGPEGKTLNVIVEYWNTATVGHPDMLQVGGRDAQYRIDFTKNDVLVKEWERACRPITIGYDGEMLFIVSLCRNRDSDYPSLLAEVSEDDVWQTVNLSVLPRSLVVENCFELRDSGTGSRLRDATYLKSIEFRRSITARVWYCMEKGVTYGEVINMTIPEDFVIDYYNRFLRAERSTSGLGL